jgi:hypothetical protein
MAVAGVQQTPPMCDFTRILRQKIINYINKLVSVLETVSEAAVKCCISTSLGTGVAAIAPFFERDCAAPTPVVNRTFSTGGLNRRFWGVAEARKRVGSKGRVLESSVV